MSENNIIAKMIFFPSRYSNKYGNPELVFVISKTKFDVLGSRSLEQLEQGRRKFFPLNRCLPFNDELWEKCAAHIEKRKALENEYQAFEKQARRSG